MEGELEFERKLRREADGEIIKLRANLNGVDLKHEEIEALMAQQLEPVPPKDATTDTDDEVEEEDEKEDKFDDGDDEESENRYVLSPQFFQRPIEWIPSKGGSAYFSGVYQ
jgi:hypothetical protein